MTPQEHQKLNEEIAKKVFGIKPRDVRVRGGTKTVSTLSDNPVFQDGVWEEGELRGYAQARNYSGCITDAWLVVKDMVDRGYQVDGGMNGAGASCQIQKWAEGALDIYVSADADTAPIAICLAALKAVEAK